MCEATGTSFFLALICTLRSGSSRPASRIRRLSSALRWPSGSCLRAASTPRITDTHTGPYSEPSGRLESLGTGKATLKMRMRRRCLIASTGSWLFSMASTSAPTRSLLTLSRRAMRTCSPEAASTRAGSSSNWKRAEKRTERRTRRGSSRKVSRGGSGVRITPARRSSIPFSVRSSTQFSLML
eukprot:1181563-Prorocentrum_minimum.AAC.4